MARLGELTCLDHKLVEFAGTIHSGLKLRGRTSKYIFKRALRGMLPDEIIDRPKHGFAIPLGSWFRGRLARFARELLLSQTCRSRGIFNADYLDRLLGRHEAGRELDLHLWTLISFEMWCRTFLDRRSSDAGKKRRPQAATAGLTNSAMEVPAR